MIVADVFPALPQIIKEAASSFLASWHIFSLRWQSARSCFSARRVRTRLGIFLLLVALALFAVAIVYRTKAFPSQRPPTAPDSNHSTVNQAMAYDHSVINQAAGDIIINNGVSEEVVRTLLREKTVAAHQELSQQYPLGYALFGIANGNVVFQPEAGLEFNPKNKAVVEIDPTKNRVTVKLVFFQATFPNGSHPIIENDEHVFAYVENKPVPFGMQFGFGKNGEAINAYIEVLDKSKFIFLLGLKYVE